MGIKQYIQDYDGRYPHAQDSSLSVSGGSIARSYPTDDPMYLWPLKVEPYIKNRQVFNCPSLKVGVNSYPDYNGTTRNVTFGWSAGDAADMAMRISYGYNGYYLGGGQFAGTQECKHVISPNSANWYSDGKGALESTVSSPASTVLLVDNNYQNYGSNTRPFVATINSFVDGEGELWHTADGSADVFDSFAPRHLDGLNVAFADGHVKWMKKEKLLNRPAGIRNGCYSANHLSTDSEFLWNRF